MIENDYITTGFQRIEEESERFQTAKRTIEPTNDKAIRQCILRQTKTNTFVSNSFRFLEQDFVSVIIKGLSILPEKRRLLYTPLSHYADKIPLCLRKHLVLTSTQADGKQTPRSPLTITQASKRKSSCKNWLQNNFHQGN